MEEFKALRTVERLQRLTGRDAEELLQAYRDYHHATET
jgi:hypothetical protein